MWLMLGVYIDGSEQAFCNFFANTLETLQSCHVTYAKGIYHVTIYL